MLLSLVVPTYNEANNVHILLDRIFKTFDNNRLDGEVIIVDDDSPDRTWHVAEQLKINYKLEVLRRVDKRGLSSAVLDGFQIAKGEVLGVMDADLSHPPEKIPELIKPILSEESDLVIGSRYIAGGKIENLNFQRKALSKIATILATGLTNVKDPMSGFFFLRKNVIEGVKLNSIGFKIGLEILVKGKYKKVTEVPILFHDRKYGESKLTNTVVTNYLSHLLKLYFYKYLKVS